MTEIRLTLLATLFLLNCQTIEKDKSCLLNVAESTNNTDEPISLNLIPNDAQYLDIACQNVGEGTTLDWAMCTRHKADSLTIVLNSLYHNHLNEIQGDVNRALYNLSESNDPQMEDVLQAEWIYYTELKEAMQHSQELFIVYVDAERELTGTLTGSGRARTGNENIREIESLLERIGYFKRLEYN